VIPIVDRALTKYSFPASTVSHSFLVLIPGRSNGVRPRIHGEGKVRPWRQRSVVTAIHYNPEELICAGHVAAVAHDVNPGLVRRCQEGLHLGILSSVGRRDGRACSNHEKRGAIEKQAAGNKGSPHGRFARRLRRAMADGWLRDTSFVVTLTVPKRV